MTGPEEGFTLIELLIVVAIIGILAAVAVPQFARTLRRSREATTKGNLATLRSAIGIAYTNNEGRYPTDDLSSLIPVYLLAIPWKDTPPYHQAGNMVGAGNMASQTASRGDWFYDNDETEPQFGTVQINCVHTDLKGMIWTSY